MFSRTIAIAAVVSASFLLSTNAVFAQNSSVIPMVTAQQELAAFQAPVAAAAQPGQFPGRMGRDIPKSGGGSVGMMSLYASTIAMQALDVHSSMTAFNQGAVEGNPLMRGVTSNKATFFATKAAAAAATIFVANRIAKRNKTTSMIFLAAVNTVYAGIVMHNYKVARQLR